MNVSDIVEDVALLLNVPPPSSLVTATPFTDAFRRRVEIELEESAAVALSSLPASLPLPSKTLPAASLTPYGNKEYRLSLPPDFLRLVSLRMSDWKTEARTLFPSDHWLLALQECDIDALAAASDRPLVFLDHTADGSGVLRIFGSGKDATVASGHYIPRPRIDAAGEIMIPPAAYHATLQELLRRLSTP